MSEFVSLMDDHLAGRVSLSPDQKRLLEAHYTHLLQWNKRMNLTSLRSSEEIIVRHYCESLVFGAELPIGEHHLVDIGSGPGFPGVPIAILLPEYKVTLLDSNARKCVFLRESTRGLLNVRVLEQRAEEIRDRFDWGVSRAVNLRDLVPVLARVAARVGLLIGEADALAVSGVPGFSWAPPVSLPWGERRVMLFGDVYPS